MMCRKDKNVILLNNLFNGEYIEKSVGGEIINMYQSDNGCFYVYINPYGNIGKKWDGRIKYVLFIRSVGNKVVKIIGKAEVEEQINTGASHKYNNSINKEQKEYIDRNKIEYGGVRLYKIGSWSEYFVTFKVKSIHKAKKDIYLSPRDNSPLLNNANIFTLQNIKKINNQSQKLYIESADKNNYRILEDIISNKDLWENKPVGKVSLNVNCEENKSFLSIIKKENDELVNSNLIAYFLKNDKDFWVDFVSKVLEIDNGIIDKTTKITRESFENIDLFIEVNNIVVVIENKIKSTINAKKDEGYSQLEKYIKAVENKYDKKFKKYYYLLRPDYNNEEYKEYDKEGKFKEIKYSRIYEIIKDRKTKKNDIEGFYFDEFKKVVKKHSSEYDNELFEIINKRFIEQIKIIKQSENYPK